MPLERQKIALPFGQGIDTKSDIKQLPLGKLSTLQNGIYTTNKKIRKRNGYNVLGGTFTGTNQNAQAVASYNGELVAFDGDSLFSYNSNSTNATWINKGAFTPCDLTTSSVNKSFGSNTSPDAAFHSSGIALYTFVTGNVYSYSIVDTNTGNLLVSNKTLDTGATQIPKPVVIGNFFLIFWVNGSALNCLAIVVSNPTTTFSIIQITNTVNNTAVYDVTVLNSIVYIGWFDNGGNISAAYMDVGLNPVQPFLYGGEMPSGGLTLFADPILNEIYFLYYNGTQVVYFIVNSTLSTIVLPKNVIELIANVKNVTGYAYNGSGAAFYEVSAATTPFNYSIRTAVVNTSVPGSPKTLLRGMALGGKAFYRVISGSIRPYIIGAYQSTLQSQYFVINTNGPVIAKVAPGLGGGLYTTKMLPETVSLGGDKYIFAALQTDLIVPSGTTTITQFGVVSAQLDFTAIQTFQKETLGGSLNFTGACPHMYDGLNCVEQNFNIFPENVTGVILGGGGNLGTGAYQWIALYEWMDNQGNLHRSEPSQASNQLNANSGDGASITIPMLRLTEKVNVIIKIYRTQKNGSTYTCVSDVLGKIANNPNVDTYTFTDTYSDAQIIGKENLYTTGGVVEDIAPPAVDSLTPYKSRMIGIQSEDKLNLWYSKQIVFAAPVEWSDLFTMRVDPRGGSCTAVSVLDDKLIVFKGQSIFYIVGDGPANTGANNDFSPAIFITNDVGTTNKRSVVQTPIGIMFQSSKGIYLLGRDLQTSYIGAPVEAFNASTVTSAQLAQNTTQIYFTLNDGITTLMYDYFYQQWSTFTNINAQDSCIFQGLHTYVNPTKLPRLGSVFQENATVHTDNGAFVPLVMTLGWISVADISGFQRLRRLMILGDYLSAHNLLVNIAYDFDPNNILQQTTINAGALLSGDVFGGDPFFGADPLFGGVAMPNVYLWRIHVKQQKATSVQITIQDNQTSNYGEGFSISNLAMEIGVKRGLFKSPAVKSFG